MFAQQTQAHGIATHVPKGDTAGQDSTQRFSNHVNTTKTLLTNICQTLNATNARHTRNTLMTRLLLLVVNYVKLHLTVYNNYLITQSEVVMGKSQTKASLY